MVETFAESPLAARTDQLASAARPDRLRLRELAFTTQINLRVDPTSDTAERIATAIRVMLPQQPGEVVTAGDLAVLWLGPDEWLIVGPQLESARTRKTLNDAVATDFGAVTDVSAHRTIIEVSGPCTRDLLAKGCSLDLHPRALAPSRCARTRLARAQVVLVCWDATAPRYWLMVRSSFACYLADWLTDAASEFRQEGWT